MDKTAQLASRLVAHYAQALGIATPGVRFVETSCGPCYDALFNRIEIDTRTLDLPERALRLVLAHEVAHATQRAALLADFAAIVLFVSLLFAVSCALFASLPEAELWQVSIPGACLALTVIASRKAWRARADARLARLELDADAKAALLCGPQATRDALKLMVARGYVDAARLHGMRCHLSLSPDDALKD
ncbi:M48 family metalloprotease [Caballeronia sp. BCC1704]|uniref:M48 family metalloprotease n=1 Tax=Caballeronia sp. BCC1704 TaxID=2676300 RepID=UPI00158D6615|nr:M48 family metalloprotease [Caballeronia sp. BCC1704]